MKRKTFLLVLSSMGLILMLSATPAPAPAAPRELKLVTFLPTHVSSVSGAKVIADKVKEKSKGQLILKILGGPEVMSGRDQPGAVVKGVIDISIVPTSYFADLVPAADIFSLTKFRKAEDGGKPGGRDEANQRRG